MLLKLTLIRLVTLFRSHILQLYREGPFPFRSKKTKDLSDQLNSCTSLFCEKMKLDTRNYEFYFPAQQIFWVNQFSYFV